MDGSTGLYSSYSKKLEREEEDGQLTANLGTK